MPILPFNREADPTDVSPHQPPGYQKTQSAAIAALADVEEHFVRTGVPRRVARVFSRDCVLTFLRSMAERQASAPVMRVYDATHEWLTIVYSNPFNDDEPGA